MEQGWLCGGAGLGWVWIWASIYRYYRYFELVFGAFLDLDLGRDLVLIRDWYWFLALVFFSLVWRRNHRVAKQVGLG